MNEQHNLPSNKKNAEKAKRLYSELFDRLEASGTKRVSKKFISSICNYYDSSIDYNQLTRVLRLADFDLSNPSDKEVPSIKGKKILNVLDKLKFLVEIPDIELKQTIEEIYKDDDKANKLPANLIGKKGSFSISKQLKSYVGDYICFFPDLSPNGKKIKHGRLNLSIDKDPSILKAFYENDIGKTYHGSCKLKRSQNLFIHLENHEESFFLAIRATSFLDIEKPILIACSAGINDMLEPVNYIEILVKTDQKEKFNNEIISFLTTRHSLDTAPIVDQVLPKSGNWSSNDRKSAPIADIYHSYNMFSHKRKDNPICKNIWKFSKQKGSIRINRIGADNEVFEGLGYIYLGYISCYLQKQSNPQKKRFYILKLPNSKQGEVFDQLEAIGLLSDQRDEIIAGKEILLRYRNGEEQLVNEIILKDDFTRIDKRVLDFLENSENSIYLLNEREQILNEKTIGIYNVYYLHSKTRNLVRNSISIYKKELQNTIIPWANYRAENIEYKTINFWVQEDSYFMEFKDPRKNDYFVFHLQSVRPETGRDIDMIFGTTSCVSYHLKGPKATAIVLLRTSNRMNSTLGLGEIIQDDNKLKEENIIKEYLDYIHVNPINIEPFQNIVELSKNLPRIKQQYFESLRNKIFNYTPQNLLEPNKKFIQGLINIMASFSKNEEVIFKKEYIGIFRYLFEEILRNLANTDSVFYATSLPLSSYFWHFENNTEDTIKNYVENSGKMMRLFFVQSEDSIPNKEELEIISRHYELYGKNDSSGRVFVTSEKLFDEPLLFATERSRSISWIVECNYKKFIKKLAVSSSNETHERLKLEFGFLTNNPSTIIVNSDIIKKWERQLKQD